MEKTSQLSIDLLEQSLLRMYYLYAPSWEKFIEHDDTPNILKTEKELAEQEYGKRIITVAKKVCDCVKSNVLRKYIKWYPPIFGYNDSMDFEFDLTDYFVDEKLNIPVYNANFKTKVTVTTIKKLFKKIEKKIETKYVEITFPEVFLKLNESFNKYVEVLETSGIIENEFLPIDFKVSLGADDNRNKNNIAELEEIDSTEKIFKIYVEDDSDTGEMKLVTLFDNFYIKVNQDGKCEFTSRKHGSPKLYLTRTFFDAYIPKRDEIERLLEEYFGINVITGDEIQETLDSYPSKVEFNTWLEERLKTVSTQNRTIEKVKFE